MNTPSFEVLPGDYFQIELFQDSGATLSVLAASNLIMEIEDFF